MIASLSLRLPSLEHIESYREHVREFEDAGEDFVPFPLGFEHRDGPALVERLARESRGEGLAQGLVAHSTYWLILDGVTVVGVCNLRHELTPFLRHEGGHIGYGVRPSARRRGYATEMLRQTLPYAAGLGLSRVLVTCAAGNQGSMRTILRNGGVLEADDVVAHDGELMHRYWIGVGPEAI